MADLLSKYYDAMNAHDVALAISFLADDVVVTFPEEERNWGGAENAREKFSGMFVRLPTFHGTYVVNHSIEKDGKAIVNVSCKFVCNASSHESSRDMQYEIELSKGKISAIMHL